MASKKIVASFNIETDEGKKNLEALERALIEMGDAGAKAAPKITRSVQNIEEAFRGFDRKLNETGNVTQRDVDKIVRQIEVMRTNVEKDFGSMAKAPKQVQDALSGYESKLKDVSTSTGKLTDAVKDNTANVQVAAGQWPGLGNALESVGGKTGQVVAGFGLVTAAFGQGWEIGQRLNKLFGTDMSLWEEVVSRFGSKLGAIIRGLSDSVVAVANLAAALITGSWSDIKRATVELKDTVVASGKTMGDVVTKYGSDWDKIHPPIKKATEEVEKHKAAVDNTAAGYAALGDAMGKTVEAIQKQSAELKKNQAAMLDAEHVVINRKKDQEDYARGVEAASQSLKDQTSEVAALTQAHGANDPMTLQAISRQTQLAQELETAKTQYDTAKTDVDDYTKKQNDASKAVDAASTAIIKLTTDLGSQQLQLIGLVPLADQYASAVEKTATKGAAAATATTQLATATSGLVTPAESAGTAVDALATNTDRAATAMGVLKTNADAAGASITALIGKINTAISKMGELDAATDRAAGGGGGDDGGGRS